MTLDEVRTKYLAYFKDRGHEVIPSASLVPENDPTTLFTGSGMQPLLPYLLGEPHPKGRRITDSQKSFRAQDIEEVGDNRHTTFFEMLGNWSLGDYFKAEQLPWFFGFLTDEVGLDPQRLYVTVFAGDPENNIPKDDESVEIWKRLFSEKGIEAKDAHMGSEEEGYERGMKEGERIFYYNAKKNWWSRAGVPANMPSGEPGGPDSEVFYDFGTEHDPKWGTQCHPNCDCGRFMEIGNSVFMEYVKNADGTFSKLPQRNVDFGGGLERITAASIENPDVFKLDVFEKLFSEIKNRYGLDYDNADAEQKKAMRIIGDHLRAAVFLAGDGVIPSNTEQGYFLRRLLRRTLYRGYKLVEGFSNLSPLTDVFIDYYHGAYPKLAEMRENIHRIFEEEEQKFSKTLVSGAKEFEKIAKDGAISGEAAFKLFSTYGFPFEMTVEMAAERGLSVDHEAFRTEMVKHQDVSRAGAEQKFKGGLADHSEMSVRYHTATHLLHKALRDVLGPDATQKGSNITPERLRFDFAFSRKMTPEEITEVEKRVNERIAESLPVTFEDLPLEEAQKKGAIGLFEEKYGDKVRVYKVGDYSLEFCGGPHVKNTSELGEGGKIFKIQKEEAVAAGIRRIKAAFV